jgi:hypothetical protein
MVTVFKQLNHRAIINDPISDVLIHSVGVLFVDNTDMYTWREHILDLEELWAQTQLKIECWSCLFNATGGALKPKNMGGIYWIITASTENGHTRT